METQDASAEFMFKFWPWFEANRHRLIIAAVVLVLAFFVWFFLATQHQQKEVAAGQAYTQFLLNPPPATATQAVADGYLKIAGDHPGTLAGQRARLQAAATLFEAGRYAEAQTQFQNFLATKGDSSLAALAQSGVAASLEAQGKLDDALAAYRKLVTAYPDSTDVILAKFAQGRVLELQGKLKDAVTAYQDVTKSPLAGSLGSEAAQRISQLQTKLAAATSATTNAPAKS
jgi:predicted negative regulator of RcsB-dependent stress response